MDKSWPVRRETFLDSGAIAAVLRDPSSFDPAAVLALAGEGGDDLTLGALALGPGEAVADLLPIEASGGFLLDLDPPGWRSEWGGLLLLQGEGDRLQGYRPVPGALTLFPATARPLISLIAPQGARRTSIIGWWRRGG